MPEPTHIPANAFIALGSNLGDREFAIESARTALGRRPEIETVRCSSLIETDPVGPPGQGPYLNGVTMVRTTLSPRTLLDAMLAIERSLGASAKSPPSGGGPEPSTSISCSTPT
ncbi:MAG: 2-amino-4-hydroxy-6-hydroxymethyldihydropteridine diphosphokinase [Phycisphaerales bacterium]